MSPTDVRDYIIAPSLVDCDLYSLSAEVLLMATCAHESSMGFHLTQKPVGPALGIFQMEPNTFRDDLEYISLRPHFQRNVKEVLGDLEPVPETVVYHLRFAALMARIHYWRFPEPLPEYTDVPGIWKYYKKYWNSPLGAARQEEFFENFKHYVLPAYRNERHSWNEALA